ncbi:MAG TPA: TRIC cation channel family protein [Actinocrinis sp.]|jgi:uncharacterized membrane protein YeiH
MHDNSLQLHEVFDVLGIFTAAASGALTGLRKGLDLVGVLVLAAVTGLGGGVVRDLMIGAVPPAVLTDPYYLSSAAAAAVVVVAVERRILPVRERIRAALPLADAYLLADACTLGLFAVSGTVKALAYGIALVPAALMGVVTAVGGGVIRDVLVNEVPTVLRREMYAIPALVGALIVALAAHHGQPVADPLAFAAAAIAAALRMVAVRRDWHARVPAPRGTGGPGGGAI